RHLAAALSGLLVRVLDARARLQDVTRPDGPDVLELLLPVEEPAIVELDGARPAHAALGPVRDRHEEGRRCDRRVALVGGVRVLDRTRELANLPVLDAHRERRTPDAELLAIDLHRQSPISCATISRFHVASPNATSELFARLK